MTTPEDIIQALHLQPHPEGGWYRETYRSAESIPHSGLPGRFSGPRPFATAIYFLLTADTFSALHRIRSDELWHFYAGSPLTIHVIEPEGAYRAIRLGPDVARGETLPGGGAGRLLVRRARRGRRAASPWSAAPWRRGSISPISRWGRGRS